MSMFCVILALAPQPAPGQEAPPLWVNLVPIMLIMVVFYFVLIRPQQKKAKEQEVMLKALKKGDKVITASGIIGVVIGIKERTVSIRSDEAKIEVLKSAVTDVTERSSTSTEA